MTAATPERIWLLDAARLIANEPIKTDKYVKATVGDLRERAEKHLAGDDADWLHGVADLLTRVAADRAAVTAERDQAIRNLCDDGPCPVEDLHRDAVIRAVAAERELEKARQMLADEKQRADQAERSRHEAWDALYKIQQQKNTIKTSPGGIGYVRPTTKKALPEANK
jgi:hypothetical protein